MSTAYDSILEYSDTNQFGEFRRILVGNRGSIANGNLVDGLSLVFDRKKSDSYDLFSEDEIESEPTGVCQKLGNNAQQPGLVFDKNGYDEILKQVESRGEIGLLSIINKLKFINEKDYEKWINLHDNTKKRLVSINLDKLKKETEIQYRTTGDRMHYLTIGMVEIIDNQDKQSNYPLFLFSCPELNITKFSANIEQTGFINFWLDKNILNNEIAKKRNNSFEISLNADFSNQVNNISQYVDDLNLGAKFKSVKVIPQYMAFQIITGFEAEYVDPAWSKILASKEIDS